MQQTYTTDTPLEQVHWKVFGSLVEKKFQPKSLPNRELLTLLTMFSFIFLLGALFSSDVSLMIVGAITVTALVVAFFRYRRGIERAYDAAVSGDQLVTFNNEVQSDERLRAIYRNWVACQKPSRIIPSYREAQSMYMLRDKVRMQESLEKAESELAQVAPGLNEQK